MPLSCPSTGNIPALFLPRFVPLGERGKWRIRWLGIRALLVEDRAGLARIRIEAESEEFRRESAEIDFSIDDRIGLVFVGERKRLRFLLGEDLQSAAVGGANRTSTSSSTVAGNGSTETMQT